MALELLAQLNEHANEQAVLESNIELNVAELMEGLNVGVAVVCEDAARILANVSIQLGSNGQVQDIEKAIDMVAGLRVLGSPVNRDALNVKAPLFKLIVQRAGENPQVDAAIAKVANHPSFASVRKEVADMLQGAGQSGDPEGVQKIVNVINKLRIGYERVSNKLNNGQATSDAAGTATAAV